MRTIPRLVICTAATLFAFATGARAQEAADTAFDFLAPLREGEVVMDADAVAARARETAPLLARAQAAGTRARELADAAFLAVYPRLDLTARYMRLSDETSGAATAVFGKPLLDQYGFQARLSYPVTDLFAQILPRYRGAQDAAEAEEWNERVAAREAALLGRESYYEYARARAALEVARAGLAQSEAQRRDVEALVTGGTLARVELLRAEAQVAAARVAIARAAGAVAVSRTNLRSLLHREGEGEVGIAEDLLLPVAAVPETKAQLLAEALHRRSELQALRSLGNAQDEAVRESQGEKLPNLSLDAIYYLGNPSSSPATPFSGFAREWEGSWTLGALLSWSPNDFVGGSVRAGEARADRAQTLAELSEMEDALRREVSRAYEDQQAAQAALDAAAIGIRASEESYRVRREQFRAGAAVATDVVFSEAELRRARLELVNAAIDVRIARARLDRALERE